MTPDETTQAIHDLWDEVGDLKRIAAHTRHELTLVKVVYAIANRQLFFGALVGAATASALGVFLT